METTPAANSRSRSFCAAPSTRTSIAAHRSRRGLDHIELLKEASDAGMAAVVTKDHDYAGVATANLIANHYGICDQALFGIVLNNVVAVQSVRRRAHRRDGGKIVWLPTLAPKTTAWEKKSSWAHPASTKKMRPATAVPATRDGRVLDEVRKSSTSSPRTHGAGRAICMSARSGCVRGGQEARRDAACRQSSGRDHRCVDE